MNNQEEIEEKIQLRSKAGETGRTDGIKYELALSEYLLSEHISNSPNSILNVLCRQKNGLTFENSEIECLDMSTDTTLLSAKTRHKTTSKVDLSIICKKINQCLNFSIKKNATGFQFHITSSNRFFEIIEQKSFSSSGSSVHLFNGFNKFLGVPGFTPEEMFKNETLSKNDYSKMKNDSRFSISELSKKEQIVFKEFFSDENNVIKLVMIFLLGYYSEEVEIVDYIIYNDKNFTELNQNVIPYFIYGQDVINYVKYQFATNKDFISFNDTTIHFGDVFTIQRKGSGKNNSERSAVQFKGKNLHKLNASINLVKENHPDYFKTNSYKTVDDVIIDFDIKKETLSIDKEEEITSIVVTNDCNEVHIVENKTTFEQIKDQIILFKNKFTKGCKAFWKAFNE